MTIILGFPYSLESALNLFSNVIVLIAAVTLFLSI
jgi:hypothetical protein